MAGQDGSILFRGVADFENSLKQTPLTSLRKNRRMEYHDVGQETGARIQSDILEKNKNHKIYMDAMGNYFQHSKPEEIYVFWKMLTDLPSSQQKKYADLVRWFDSNHLQNSVFSYRATQSHLFTPIFQRTIEPDRFYVHELLLKLHPDVTQVPLANTPGLLGKNIHHVKWSQTFQHPLLTANNETIDLLLDFDQIIKASNGEAWVKAYPAKETPIGSFDANLKMPIVVRLTDEGQGYTVKNLVRATEADQLAWLKMNQINPNDLKKQLAFVKESADVHAQNQLREYFLTFEKAGMNAPRKFYLDGSQGEIAQFQRLNQYLKDEGMGVAQTLSLRLFQSVSAALKNLPTSNTTMSNLFRVRPQNTRFVIQTDQYLPLEHNASILMQKEFSIAKITNTKNAQTDLEEFVVYLQPK